MRDAAKSLWAIFLLSVAITLPSIFYVQLSSRIENHDKTGYVITCKKVDKLRLEIVNVGEASIAAAQQALADATTDAERQAAAVNLARSQVFARNIEAQLEADKCEWPPESPTPTAVRQPPYVQVPNEVAPRHG